MKTNKSHRQLHPIQWHGSMYLAIAALVLTATKTSSDMLRYLQQAPVHTSALSSIFLRDAETVHLTINFGGAGRHTTFSGR